MINLNKIGLKVLAGTIVYFLILPIPLTNGDLFWGESVTKSTPDTSFRKSKKGFGAMLFLITDRSFFDKWLTPNKKYNIPEVKEIVVGGGFIAVVLFSNPAVGNDGNSEVTYDIEVIKPNGKVLKKYDELIALKNRPPPASRKNQHQIELALQYPAIQVPANEQVGTYTVRAIVRDKIRKVDIPLEQTISVRPNAS